MKKAETHSETELCSKSDAQPRSGSEREKFFDRRSATVRLVTDALLAALFILFSGVLSVKLPLIEISLFVSLPLIFAAFLFTPADAFAVALVGTFAEQVLYGLAWNAPLWMASAILQALFLSFALLLFPSARKIRKPKGVPNPLSLVIIVLGDLLLSAGNLAVTYLDAAIYHYNVGAFTLALVLTKAGNFAIRTAISCVLAYILVPYLQKLTDKRR